MAHLSSFLSQTPNRAAYACIAAALGLVLLLGTWAAYDDVTQVRASRAHSEITRLRSHAERSAGHLESQLSEEGPGADLARVGHSSWLRDHWRRLSVRQPERLYAAVVDRGGRIVAHSQPEREGQTLGLPWFERVIGSPSDGAHDTADDALTGGRRAVDVRVPILLKGREVGAYHSGLNAEWMDAVLAADTRQRWAEWAGAIGAITVVVLLSSISLYRITRHTTRLENSLELAEARRVAEISQLVIGLAHEIRNPLNALRMNLHTLERIHRGEAGMPTAEVTVMLRESTREIEQLEVLMRGVLGYARPVPAAAVAVDVGEEIRATLAFLKQKLDHCGIAVAVCTPALPVSLYIDPARLRQMLLNLLTNACEALDQGGQIEIVVHRHRDRLELTVADNGPGIAPEHRARVFEPFFSTKPGGTGLGLALVRKFAEEAGGQVDCEPNPAGRGSLFRVSWPRRRTEETGR